ncbi:MAG TPA: hypothetical protein VK619_12130 [Pyrinomonadaceae bacterium]|nr:hypothetical protein [Pyrinomonadaceae bacterium]
MGDSATLTFELKVKTAQARQEFRDFRSEMVSEIKKLVSQFPGQDSLSGFSGAIRQTARLATADFTSISGAASGTAAGLGLIAGPGGIAAAVIASVSTAAVGAVTSLYALAQSAANVGDEIYKAHLRTQLSTESLSALRVAARENGIAFTQVVSGIDRYLKNVDEGALGNKRLAQSLRDLGIDAQKAAQNPQAAVEQLIKAWSQLAPTADRNDAAIKLMGKSGDQLIPMLDALGGSLQSATRRAQELGESFDEKTSEAAHRLTVATNDLSAAWEGLKVALGTQAIADTTQIVEGLTKAIEDNRESSKWLIDILKDVVQWMRILWDASVLLTAPFVTTGALVLTLAEDLAALGHAISSLLTGDIEGLKQAFVEVENAGARLQSRLQSISDTAGMAANDIATAIGWLSGATAQAAQSTGVERGSGAGGSLTRSDIRRIMGASYIPQPGDAGYAGNLHLTPRAGGSHQASQEDQETRARIKTLEVQAKAAQRIYHEEAEAIEREYKLRALALDQYVQRETAAATKVRDAELKTIDAEITAAEHLNKSRDREVKLAELRERRAATVGQFNERIQKINDHAGEEELITLRAHYESLLKLGSEYDRQRIDALQYAENRRLISAETAEHQMGQIRLAALDRLRDQVRDELHLMDERSEAYKRLHLRLEEIAAERATLEQETNRKIQDARQQDIERQRQFNEQMFKLQTDELQNALEVGQARIEDMKRHNADRNEIIGAQLRFDLDSEQLRHSQAMHALENMETEDLRQAHGLEQLINVLKHYHNLIEIEDQRHADERQRIYEQSYTQQNQGFFSGEFRGALPQFDDAGNITEKASAGKNALAGLSAAMRDFKNMGKQAFGSFAEGLGQVVENFVLLGTTGPHALRKVTASVLAELAKQATVKALMALADGFVHLFTDPPQAAADFTAAAIYASIAGVSAALGRQTAGDLFQQQSAGTGAATGSSGFGGSTTSSSQPQVTEINRTQAAQPLIIHLIHEVKSNDSHIVKTITQDIKLNGQTRQVILSHATGG